jgi:hypothetical protein
MFQADVWEFELEIINIQSDIMLQSYAKEHNFWKLVDRIKYPILQGTAVMINFLQINLSLWGTLFKHEENKVKM